MRITEAMLNRTIIGSINKSKSYLGKIQRMLSTGKRINKPSDNPLLISRSLELRGKLRDIEQYLKNIHLASTYVDLAAQVIMEVGTLLNDVKIIALRESNATATADSRKSSAVEVASLRGQLLNLANTSFGGRYIFAGTRTRTVPFTEDGTYQGDEGEIKIQVGENHTIAINVPGDRIFKVTKDIFKVLSDLKQALENNSVEDIRNQINEIDECISQVHRWEGEVGGRARRIEIFQNRLKDMEVQMTKFLSSTEDADVTKVAIELQSAGMAYQGALAAAQQILQSTMLRFFE